MQNFAYFQRIFLPLRTLRIVPYDLFVCLLRQCTCVYMDDMPVYVCMYVCLSVTTVYMDAEDEQLLEDEVAIPTDSKR